MSPTAQQRLAILQLDFLDKAKEISPKAPIKFIVRFSKYDSRTKATLRLLEKRGFKLEFEMPLDKKICGSIRASRTDLIKRLKNEGKIEAFEICGMSPIETM